MNEVSVFQPVGAHAMATQTAMTWADDKAGMPPAIAEEFASYYAHHMTERTTKPWEWDNPTDVWGEWVDMLAGLGAE